MINGSKALEKLLTLPFTTVLDLGAGEGKHSQVFRDHGKKVTSITWQDGDYLDQKFDPFDCIWACHVLEHQPNPNLFLRKCFSELVPGGIFAVTVPPLKHEIVGGHVSLWNAGLLLYHLVLAGFDCSEASVKTYGYNISVIVRKKAAVLPPLAYDFGDIEKICKFFPFPVQHGFDGRIEECNW